METLNVSHLVLQLVFTSFTYYYVRRSFISLLYRGRSYGRVNETQKVAIQKQPPDGRLISQNNSGKKRPRSHDKPWNVQFGHSYNGNF